MKIISRCWLILFLAAALAGGVLASPQDSNDKNKKQQTKTDKDKSADQEKNKDKNQDKPKTDDSGFGGTLTTKSSKKTTDTATLGFKGVDGNGYVDPDKLKEEPNGDDLRIAQLMTGVKTNPDEAKVFVDNGKLKSR
jgi:Ni/Co efflux regulator RcnB